MMKIEIVMYIMDKSLITFMLNIFIITLSVETIRNFLLCFCGLLVVFRMNEFIVELLDCINAYHQAYQND